MLFCLHQLEIYLVQRHTKVRVFSAPPSDAVPRALCPLCPLGTSLDDNKCGLIALVQYKTLFHTKYLIMQTPPFSIVHASTRKNTMSL